MYVVHHNRFLDSFRIQRILILTETGFGSHMDIIFQKQDRIA